MKGSTKWLGALFFVMMAAPIVWADDHIDVFELTIKDLAWMFEDTSLNNQIVVIPAGMEVSWMNVDPLITSSGLEGIMPHGVKLTNQGGEVIAQSPLLFQNTTTFNHKFTDPGVYDLQCIVHPFMKAKFLVFEIEQATMIAEHAAAE